MLLSGIAPLDAQLGGVSAGRLHLLMGGPGTGKSTACLQFLLAGLRRGEPAALVTLDGLSDLASHARSTGLNVESALRTGRLSLLRFRAEFTRLLDCAGTPDPVTDDLRRLIGDVRHGRLVIDPLTPFLADGSASGSALSALAEWIEELGVTAFVTYPRDVSNGCDARLDPIVQRAATIVHLARGGGRTHQMHVVQSRTGGAPGVVRYRLMPGLGLVTVDGKHPSIRPDGAGTNGDGGRVWQGASPT